MTNLNNQIDQILGQFIDDWEKLDSTEVYTPVFDNAKAAIKQLLVTARIDELEKVTKTIECLRPDCTTDHSNLRKKYVADRIAALKSQR